MIPSKAQIKALEEPLDYCLSRRPIFGFDANETLLLVANAAETASVHNLDGAMHSTLSHGIDAYAAHLVSGRQGPAPDIEQVIADLVFGAHYQSLRELLYYSYNAPGTIDWTLADGRI